MKKLTTKFIDAKKEFLNSKGSEKSVENLYDIVYLLKGIEERNFEENYILAQIYKLLGEIIFAEKIIDKELVKSNLIQKMKLKQLLFKLNKLDNWNVKIYRDLRDSKLIKKPTILSIEDFIILKDKMEYCIGISNKIKSLVIINKNIIIENRLFNDGNNIAFSQTEPTNALLVKLLEHIEWLGQIKDELLSFYNKDFFGEGKLNNVGQKWYDGISIGDFSIYIDEVNNFETEIIVYDYLQNDYGFRLEIENKNIKNIKYDPIL